MEGEGEEEREREGREKKNKIPTLREGVYTLFCLLHYLHCLWNLNGQMYLQSTICSCTCIILVFN